MKKIAIIIFVTTIVSFMSCSKDDPITIDPTETTDDNDDGNSSTSSEIWRYEITDFDRYLSDLAVDDNDNSYFVVRTESYYLISIDKNGTENWKAELPSASYSSTFLMIADGNIIIVTEQKIYSYNLSGTLNWEADISTYCISAAYSNNTIYTVGTNVLTDEAIISAYTTTGSLKWEYILTKHRYPILSSYQNYICFSSEDYEEYPYKKGFIILEDNGSSASPLWNAYSDLATTPNTKASFDINGNVYYEESLNDTTYISSYKVENGTKNWTTKLTEHHVHRPIILTENNMIVASYIDNDDDGGVNSLAFIEPTTGSIISNFDDKLTETSVFLNENSSVITFDYVETDNVGPTIHIISSSGITNSFDGSIVGDIMSFQDCKINSTGNILYLDDKSLICGEAKSEYKLSSAIGIWNSRNGNNYNTNSLLQ